MFAWPPAFIRPRRPAPAPAVVDVVHRDQTFRVTVRRSRAARRLILKVRSDTGEPVLTLPSRTSMALAKDFLDRHGGWLAERVRRMPDRVDFVDGAIIPLRGVDHRIVHREGTRGRLRILPPDQPGGMNAIEITAPADHLARRLVDALKTQAEADLRIAVARHAATLGVTVGRISIKDTRSRWGSCSARGTLSFSWRLVLAPPLVLDYLAAHEVAHRREMNHSHRYWAAVADAFPRWQEAEHWLTRHGAGLHRYGPPPGQRARP